MNFIILDRGDNWLSLEYERTLMLFYYGLWLMVFWNKDVDLFKWGGLLLLFFCIILEAGQIEVIAVIMFILLNLIKNLECLYWILKKSNIKYRKQIFKCIN
jgi:hypothetical protein